MFYETNSNADYYLDDDIKSNFSQIIKTTIYATPQRKRKKITTEVKEQLQNLIDEVMNLID